MSIDGEKIEKLKAYVSRIYEIFEKRPGMLGAPDEICVALTFLDNVNDILTGDVDFYGDKEVSWYDFLIEKKLIVGAENKLKIKLTTDAPKGCEFLIAASLGRLNEFQVAAQFFPKTPWPQ